jgi:AAA domain
MSRAPIVRELRVTAASEIEPRPIRWLWEPRMPLGKLTILAGQAGQAKSTLTCLMAALVSTGSAPGVLLHTVSDVLLVSAEDDPSDTIVPRLIAAGAALERVHVLDVREIVEGTPFACSVSLPGDVPAIHRAVQQYGARLVILDPVTGLLDAEHSAISNQEVRRALGPVKEMAQETGCAVVAVMHPNKSAGTSALARIADSGAFTALARSVMFMGPDPADPDGERGSQKVLALPKSNLAGRGEHSLALRIEDATIPGPDGEEIRTSRVVVEGTSDVTASDLLADDGTQLGEARAFLRAELADGAKPARDVQKTADDADISTRTLRRARELECDVEKERGSRGAWVWRLKVTSTHEAPQDGRLGHLQALEPNLTTVNGDHADQDVQDDHLEGGRRAWSPSSDDELVDRAERLAAKHDAELNGGTSS